MEKGKKDLDTIYEKENEKENENENENELEIDQIEDDAFKVYTKKEFLEEYEEYKQSIDSQVNLIQKRGGTKKLTILFAVCEKLDKALKNYSNKKSNNKNDNSYNEYLKALAERDEVGRRYLKSLSPANKDILFNQYNVLQQAILNMERFVSLNNKFVSPDIFKSHLAYKAKIENLAFFVFDDKNEKLGNYSKEEVEQNIRKANALETYFINSSKTEQNSHLKTVLAGYAKYCACNKIISNPLFKGTPEFFEALKYMLEVQVSVMEDPMYLKKIQSKKERVKASTAVEIKSLGSFADAIMSRVSKDRKEGKITKRAEKETLNFIKTRKLKIDFKRWVVRGLEEIKFFVKIHYELLSDENTFNQFSDKFKHEFNKMDRLIKAGATDSSMRRKWFNKLDKELKNRSIKKEFLVEINNEIITKELLNRDKNRLSINNNLYGKIGSIIRNNIYDTELIEKNTESVILGGAFDDGDEDDEDDLEQLRVALKVPKAKINKAKSDRSSLVNRVGNLGIDAAYGVGGAVKSVGGGIFAALGYTGSTLMRFLSSPAGVKLQDGLVEHGLRGVILKGEEYFGVPLRERTVYESAKEAIVGPHYTKQPQPTSKNGFLQAEEEVPSQPTNPKKDDEGIVCSMWKMFGMGC